MDRSVAEIGRQSPPDWGSYLISGVGFLLVLLWLWYALAFDYLRPSSAVLSPEAVIGLKIVETTVIVGISVTLVYAGYWFDHSRFDGDQEWRAALWTILGGIAIVSVIVVMNAHQMAEGSRISPGLLIEEILLGAAGGSLAGLLIGLGTAQSLRQADRVERQRNAFNFLNKLLRHNILNGLSIVQGRLSLIKEEAPEAIRSDIRSIEDRSQSMAELTQNVSRMARVISGEADLEPIDISAVLSEEVETARGSFEQAKFTASIPEGITINSTRALRGVLDNLLTNAVEHNEAETPRVDVTLTNSEETVEISVADNGPGLSAVERDEIFEPNTKGNHGMGLYLVDTIVSNVGGRVSVRDNEPTGAVFTIELPRNPPEDRAL